MSLISFAATRNRFAAWLALLALLLLFVAPVISKSLAQWHGNGMMTPPASPVSAPAHSRHGSEHDISVTHHHTAAQHETSRTPPVPAAEAQPATRGDPAAMHSMSAMIHSTLTSPTDVTVPPHQPPAGNPMAGMIMPASHHGMPGMDDSACGYCVLLLHLVLTLALLPLLWSLRQAAALAAVPLFQPVVARFVPRYFHTRAPPVLSASH